MTFQHFAVRLLVVLTLIPGRQLRGLAVAGVTELGGLVDRRAAGARRDLQPDRRLALRRDDVAASGSARRATPAPGRHRRRLHHHLQRAGRDGDEHRAAPHEPSAIRTRPGSSTTAPVRRWRRPRRAEGIGYLTRSADWQDRPRHAKAGNLNNALVATEGEFLLILDADQVPDPEILDRTLGYFNDRRVALVQTPQYSSTSRRRPAGQPGAAVLRPHPAGQGRLERGVLLWLQRRPAPGGADAARHRCGTSRRSSASSGGPCAAADYAIAKARAFAEAADRSGRRRSTQVRGRRSVPSAELKPGEPLADVTYRFQREVTGRATIVTGRPGRRGPSRPTSRDHRDGPGAATPAAPRESDVALDRLADRDWSPLGALESVRALSRAVDVDRPDEAQP